MTRDEAKLKYEKYRSLDPFPEIQPALLNSADVFDYINAIGMVYPFEDGQLNGVTLSLRVGAIALYWDTKYEKNEVVRNYIEIEREKGFTLKSNSIAYVQVQEELRLPAYIIARFNLRVTNAYRGILLGTGPIVDPGFVGKLFIPLHNLTNNDYFFKPGEALIEMEFTKLSENSTWKNDLTSGNPTRTGTYKGWKPTFDRVETEQRDIDYYLRRANGGHSIQSSLPPLVNKVDESVKKAEKVSDKVDTNLGRYNIFILISFIALLGAVATITGIFKADVRDLRNKNYDEQIETIQKQQKKIESQLDSVLRGIKRIR